MRKAEVKTENYLVRLSPTQSTLLKKMAKSLNMAPTTLIRVCVTTELVKRTGDVKMINSLIEAAKAGVEAWVELSVDERTKGGKKSA